MTDPRAFIQTMIGLASASLGLAAALGNPARLGGQATFASEAEG